jgi:hypothetical protein
MPRNGKPHLVATGDVFGRLIVLGYSHSDKRWRRHYLVRCACGAEKTVQGALLRSGNTQSCGCQAMDAKRAQRLPNDAGVITAILLQYRRHARDRGIEFLLSRESVDELVRQPCAYCGDPAGNLKRTKNLPDGFPHNGIDRVDSSLPYIAGNVVPCCGLCNRAKRDMPRDQFLAWARRVAAHQASMADQWGGYAMEVAA